LESIEESTFFLHCIKHKAHQDHCVVGYDTICSGTSITSQKTNCQGNNKSHINHTADCFKHCQQIFTLCHVPSLLFW